MRRQKPIDVAARLRVYWNEDVQSFEIPAEMVERVMLRARRDEISVQGRFGRSFRRALMGFVGLMVIGVIGLVVLPHSKPYGAYESLHGVSQGGASVAESFYLPGRFAVVAISGDSRLWAIGRHSGSWVLNTSTHPRSSWTTVMTIAGDSRGTPRLMFLSHDKGWLIVPGSHRIWRAWDTMDGGIHWTRVTLPAATSFYSSVELTPVLSSSPILVLSGSSVRPSRFYQETARGVWEPMIVYGLPKSEIRVGFATRQIGYLWSGDMLYTSRDGGTRWKLVKSVGDNAVMSSRLVSPSKRLIWVDQALDMIEPSVGKSWWVDASGILWQSRNKGIRWIRIGTMPFSGAPRSLGFQGSRGYALSARGVLWMTHNGGKSWERV